MNIEDDPRPIYASPMDVETYRLLGLDKHGPKAVNGHSNADVEASLNHEGDAGYLPCSEAHPARIARNTVVPNNLQRPIIVSPKGSYC